MQSVGEVMAIGRTFPESLQKAVRSPRAGTGRAERATPRRARIDDGSTEELLERVVTPTPRAPVRARGAPAAGCDGRATLAASTGIDPWFVSEIARIATARLALDLQVTLGVDPRGPRPPVVADREAAGLLRPAARPPLRERDDRTRSGRGAWRSPARGHLQDGRHLRRRVRGPHPVPLLDRRGRGRGASLGRGRG